MYAVFATGGKQYRVSPGDTLRVEKLDAQLGDAVEFDQILLISRDGDVTLGAPTVPSAKVVGQVVEHGRGPKITIFKKKRRKQYKRTNGHRQAYTALRIERIA